MTEGSRTNSRDPNTYQVVPHDVRHQGRVMLAADPTEDLEAATARYVDAAASAGGVADATVTDAGDLLFTKYDGSTILAGAVVGPAGATGATGDAGAQGPAGPASVVGTAKGVWNASTNTPTLSNGSGSAGDAYVVSVAGTTSLDGTASWSVGDVALRGASTWARVPAASASGAFDQVTLPKATLASNFATSEGMDFADPYGEVILRLRADQVIMNGFTVGPAGPAFDSADLATADIDALTATAATIGGAGHASNGDTDAAFVFADPYGEVILRLEADQVTMPGLTVTPAGPTFETASIGEATIDTLAATAATLGTMDVLDDGNAAGLIFVDPYGEIFASWDAAGTPAGFATDGTTGGGGTHSATEIAARNAENLAAAAGMATMLDLGVARPVWQYNQVVVYGQSLGSGTEGTPTLSRTAKYGNLMVGDKTTSVTNTMPGANNATPPTWQVTGVAQFNPLVATDGVSAETVLHGALNTYRRMTLAWRGVQSDTAHLLVGAGAAIGGLDVVGLQKGASPDLFNRIISLLSQAHSIATTAGGDYGVVGLLWLQGEGDQSQTSAYYLPKLRDIYDDFVTYSVAETSQADPPAVFSYQTAAPNTNFDNADLGVPMAQLTAALDDDGVFMVGPNYPYPDSNNLHLVANGYRWLGSQFGKVMFRVLTLGHRWKPLHMRAATLAGREILVDFHVPHPPLVFDDPWLQAGWSVGSVTTGGTNTQYSQADKGFSVRDTVGGAHAIDTVELASDTQVLITLTDVPSSALSLLVRYADGLHKGHGNVRDSDPAEADDTYLDGVVGQVAGETNATLSGHRYALWNWAVAQQIDVEA